MLVRVADYIASFIASHGTDAVFLLSGGGMMHLIDAVGRQPGLRYVCHHHEQAAAIAADAYARRTGGVGVCYATSGPGATNLLTGLVGAWQDSVPVLFLTGQSKVQQTIANSGIPGLRQFGTFEVDIVPIVEPVTKYAVMVRDPETIRFHLEKAWHLARSGRPGPVLLDVPLDVQGALIDPDALAGFDGKDEQRATTDCSGQLIDVWRRAKRPVILAGHGVRMAGVADSFQRFVEKHRLPVVTTQLGKDILSYDHPCFVGHPGPKGDRAGNLALQTADLIISVGCSLHSQTTGWEDDLFAPNAFKVQVELDDAVLKRESVGVDLKITADAASFLEAAHKSLDVAREDGEWLAKCSEWKARFAVRNEPHAREDGKVNLYDFVEVLSRHAPGDACLVTDAGSPFYVMGQALRIKQGQRFISSGSLGAMGFALPAANGAATAGGPTICVTGDGSLMTNVHDLATMKQYALDLKLFVMNNDGYMSIRSTQRAFFNSFFVGTDRESGVYIPDLKALADCFGIPYLSCTDPLDMDATISKALAVEGPVFCEVICMRNQPIIPTVPSVRLPDGRMRSRPIHEMAPDLPAGAIDVEMAIAKGWLKGSV